MKICISTILILICTFALYGQSVKKENYVYWAAENKESAGIKFDKNTVDGETFFIFDTAEFSLAMRGVAFKKALAVEVYLKTIDKSKRIDFDPNKSRIAVYAKRGDTVFTELAPLTPEEAADKLDGSSAKVKNFFDRWRGNMANKTATVNSTTDGELTVRDSSSNTASGTYQGNTRSTVSVPDEEARSEAERKVRARNAKVEANASSVLQSALRANTIFAGKDVMGYIYFPVKKGEFSWVSIQIGDKLCIKGFTLSPK